MTGNHNSTREFIAFMVRGRQFCIDITSIREIRGWNSATKLPHVPDYVVGVVNLRGTILPIIDVSARFGLGDCEPSPQSVVIVAQVGDRLAGMLVDSVSDILQVDPDDIRELPDMDTPVGAEFLRQVILHEDAIICEIMLENIFSLALQEAA